MELLELHAMFFSYTVGLCLIIQLTRTVVSWEMIQQML
jgi:hypothetical protein